MGTLQIKSSHPLGVTIIPNYFLDEYMPQAGGEFVKIYLYLLRQVQQEHKNTLADMADSLNCTERDIIRALKYWEKQGLLQLSWDQNKKLSGLTLLDATASTTTTQEISSMQIAAASEVLPKDGSKENLKENNKGENKVVSESKPQSKRQPLTADKVKQLKENEDIALLLFTAQQYLGKPLTPTETNRLLYFYDELGFSTDLIEYLIEYCVDRGHRSLNYIEKVAFAWKEDGIQSVKQAKQSSESYHKDYYTILKALGISGRNPIDAEIRIMDTWMKDYGFSLELITEACTRTILATKQPSLQYADGILQRWKEAGARTKADVDKLDAQHQQKTTRSPKKNDTPSKGNRFNNFEQRDYDMDALERKLLNQ